uniref:NHS-like 2 n=1 Tax=Nothobranchius kadleci TaxID=1051664 RepID=A0A1A8D0M9_NOTKA
MDQDMNFTSTGNGNTMAIDYQEHHTFHGRGDSYALLYPRGSSEDSASTTDTVSVTASDYSTEGRLRLRSRSISLKKSKRKPPPPVRSVSLMKNLGEAEGRLRHEGGLYRDGRPKSLHIPRDHFPDFQPDFLLTSSSCSSKTSVCERELGQCGNEGPPSLEIHAPERERETEMTFSAHWQLGEWKSNDPYRECTSGAVINQAKAKGKQATFRHIHSTKTWKKRPVPLGNIYKVMKKPKPKKPTPQAPTNSAVLPDSNSTNVPKSTYDHHFLVHPQSLFDLPPLPDPQPLLEDPLLEPEFDGESDSCLGPEDGGSLPSPCSNKETPELQDKSKTLPSRMTISCLAELSDKKKAKVPPPVPKKPNVLLLPTSHQSTNGSTDRQNQTDSPVGLRSPDGTFAPDEIVPTPSVPETPEQDETNLGTNEDSSKESSLQSSLQDSFTELEGKVANTIIGSDDSTTDEKAVLHITEETDDDLLTSTSTTHTTEDLFTIIHRSKRKVLGRKEPSDSFGSRQSLVSPVKHSTSGSDLRNFTLGSSQRSSSRNENFMALLQKKGSKSSSGGARVSAMELLKSTNPLARRVTEFSSTMASNAEGGDAPFGTDTSTDQ